LPRFEHFLSALPKGYIHAIEFRDESWLIDEVFQLMERHNVAHCIHDVMLLKIPRRVTAPLVYLRFHGDVLHGGDYSLSTLRTWAKRIEAWRSQGRDVFIYFNNDVGGYAVQNAMMLRGLLAHNQRSC
jgi:uncharacterized protein YecE (DUF72 family)